ncbi:MAG: histidine kinase, partial [Bacteroidales bacterium]|nr:histidine kinase [Bacteroidales bacterium]
MNSKRQISILLIQLVFAFSFVDAQKYNFKNFTIDDGLTQSEIYAIAEDTLGHLWLGTLGGGVMKFDGYNFESYRKEDGLVNNFVRVIYCDSKGLLWFGTEQGLCTYDGYTFSTFGDSTPLENRIVRTIIEDYNHNHWIGTQESGAVVITDTGFYQLNVVNGLPHNQVNCLYQSNDSSIWIGTQKGFARYKNGLNDNKNRLYGLKRTAIRGICEDSDGRMWFATYRKGIKLVDNDTIIAYSYPTIPSSRIYTLLKDKHGKIWSGTSAGLSRFYNQKFTHFSERNGLPSNVVVCMGNDNSQNLWLGTSGGGISRFNNERFVHYTENSHMGRRVFAVEQALNGNMIFATSYGGITVFDGKKYSHVNKQSGFTDAIVKALYYAPDSALWIGTMTDGAYRFDKKGFKRFGYEHGLCSDNINGFATDTAGNTWFSTVDSGICVLSSDTLLIKKFTANNGLSHNSTYSILADSNGFIWVGTESGGLNRLQLYASDSVLPQIVNYTTKNGLTSNTVRVLNLDSNGNLVIGTSGGGINFLRNDTFTSIGTKDGLYSDIIYSLLYDKEYFLWSGTEKGIDRIQLDTNFKVVDIRHFGRNEGFSGVEVYSNATCVDDSGRIWFGTINGATVYNAKEDEIINQPPKIYITGIRLFYEKIEETNLVDSTLPCYPIPFELELPFNQDNLSFEFTGIYLRNPESVRYRWRLMGVDDDWTPPLNQRKATYSNLEPGNYTFEVIACNEYNVWNDIPATFSFTILTPWWKESWFMISAAGCILILLFLAVFTRIRRIQQKNNRAREKIEMEKNIIELEQEAARLQMNPHFIFNSLNSIQGFIATNDQFQAKRYLAKFARLMRLILENAREEYIPLQNEIDILDNYLELEKLSTNNKFDFVIKVDDEIDSEMTEIPPMMIQPFVENAIVHGIKKKEGNGLISILFK